MFLIILIYQICAQKLQCKIQVDEIEKGYITFELYCNETPESCKNFIEIQSFKIIHINQEKIEIQNQLQINKTWKSEINQRYTQFGSLGQQRNIETGEVDLIYTIFLKKQDFDGPKSQWLVFGNIITEHDKNLLKYIKWTTISSNELPNRNIYLNCSL